MIGTVGLGYILVCLIKIVISVAVYEESIVETRVGGIKGLKSSDGDYYMYLGIPYAKLQENVFAESIQHPPFEQPFEAYDEKVMCPQLNLQNGTTMFNGTPECLRLNIYVPSAVFTLNSMHANFPVMIWIYGGGFQHGHAGRDLYGPNYLLRQHDVIVVTVNYRLGPYGFMCLALPEVSGNQGLKDQYIAIKWINENIQAFGGDSKHITLFGQGAGGHSIDLHLLSTWKKMFNNAIIQSGSAYSYTLAHKPDRLAPLKIAEAMGYVTNDTVSALLYLSRTEAQLVITVAQRLKIKFLPCAEIKYGGFKPFLFKPWINTKITKNKRLPVLIGFNKHELSSAFYRKNNVAEYLKNIEETNFTIIYNHLKKSFDLSHKRLIELTTMVSNFYFGEETKTKKTQLEITHFGSDYTYIHPIYRTIQNYIESGAGHIYLYMFSYVGSRNPINFNDDLSSPRYRNCCAAHGDEVGYIFNGHGQPNLTINDKIIMQRMTSMWTNFAKFSDPTPDFYEIFPVKWEPVTKNIYYYLNIDKTLSLEKRPLHERMAFWDLFYLYNKKFQFGYEEQY